MRRCRSLGLRGRTTRRSTTTSIGASCIFSSLILSLRSEDLAVDPHANEAGLAHVFEDRLVLALAVPHQRREDHQARTSGRPSTASTICSTGLLLDRPAALRAVRASDPRVQQAQIVVDLGDRADRRARVVAGALLVDRDGRREPRDVIDVGLVHLAQELAGVGRQRSRHTGAGPRRRSCRRPATTCPSPTGR